MRFGVLGPLDVRAGDGTPVKVADRKVRALLVDLLAHAGRVVPSGRLIDDLWGDALPADPAATLQARVSQLRRTLDDAEPGARALVERIPPGYRLNARPGDVARFEELAEDARAATDPVTRAALLADALALWRGPAYADFADAPFTAPEITRLDELRLAAAEARAEARLELGDHEALAAELGGLVREHPLRERLRASYMRALDRAGRSAEALTTYEDLRRRLSEDLGADPGPPLADLHLSILRRASTTPGNLPADVTSLIGRDAAAVDVADVLGRARTVTLTGPGGVGKTRLAVAVARQARERHPGGVWLVALDEGLKAGASADDVASFVAATLGLRDDAGLAGGPARRLGEALRGRRVLLVLDNCEHVVEPVARLVAGLLRDTAEPRVLATSREPLGISGERLWHVPPLAAGDAAALFTERAALAPGSSPRAVADICARLDGIPLALELAATRVRALGVEELAARLDDRFRLLSSGRRDAPARQRTLRAMIDWSWEPLTGPERAALRRLAVHPGGCTLDAADEVCGAGVDVLASLVDRSLVVVGEGPRYRLLESVAAYCAERLREAGEYDVTRRRHAEYYTALAERADLRGPGQREALRRLRAESGNLRAALDTAAGDGAADLALRLVNAMGWAWFLWGRPAEASRAFERALAVPGGDPAGTAVALTWHTGFTMLDGDGRDRDDRCRAALAAHPGENPWARWFLAFVRTGFGDLAAIEDLTAQALTGYRSTPAERHPASANPAGSPKTASHRSGLPSGPNPGDDGRADRAAHGVNRADRGWGRPDEEAADGDEKGPTPLAGNAGFPDGRFPAGDVWGEAAVLVLRAGQAVSAGDLPRAGREGERARALFREVGDRWGHLQATETLGLLAEVTGDYARAARLHESGLRDAEELGLWTEASGALSRLGRIALLTGDHDRADDLHERARRLAVRESHRRMEHFAEIGLALAARRRGRLDEAEAILRGWLDWCRAIDGAPGLALLLAELGFIAELRGDAGQALDLHAEGLATARATGNPRAVALAMEGMAGALTLAGRHEEAAASLDAAAAARSAAGAPLPAAERGDVDRIAARLRRGRPR